ncbi:hypothetical protein GCM10010208_49100 [Actinomadura livida]|nr:hypothetical protein GCM10010208_49100 [Actinomadura livida]
MIVSRVLVPGSEKGPRRSEPRVREQVEGGRVHRDPRMSEKGYLRHVETVSPRPLHRTHRNAQSGYAVGMKEKAGGDLTIATETLP